MRSSLKSPYVLLTLLVIGGLIGTLLGQTFGQYLPILKTGFEPIGLKPATINLVVISITFGFTMKLNVAGLIGFLLALFIYFRL